MENNNNVLQITNEDYSKISQLGNNELRIYLYINMNGNCILSIYEIADICKISRQAMYKAIDKLNFNGLIDVRKVDSSYSFDCKESLQASTADTVNKVDNTEVPEETLVDKAVKEFPQFEGMTERDIANKIGCMTIRKQADKHKYRELLEAYGWNRLFQ